MDFINEPTNPVTAAQNGRLQTTNWDDLFKLRDVLSYDPEKVKKINDQAKAEMTADGVVTWKEFSDTVARYFPEFVDAEAAKGWDANMHFLISQDQWEYTLEIKDGEATYHQGLIGDPTSVTAMDTETFISTVLYTKQYDQGELELTDEELEGVAGGKGASACGAEACGGDACGADASGTGACGGAACAAAACGGAACGGDACGAAACGGAACGAAGCGGAVCGGDACGGAACGGAACGAAAAGIGACGADACGAAACGIVLTGADACAADACGIDVIPVIPGI